MKKLLAGAAVFAVATVGALASYSPANAVTIIDPGNDFTRDNYVTGNSQMVWPEMDGVASYSIYMYSPTANLYSLQTPYHGQYAYADAFNLVDNYCSEVANNGHTCVQLGTVEYPFVIVGFDQNGKIIAYSDEYTLIKTSPNSEPATISIVPRNYLTYTPTESFLVASDFNGGIVPEFWTNLGYTGVTSADKGTIYFAPESTSFVDDNTNFEEDEYANYKMRAPSGKTFDAIEINGVRYAENEPYLINSSVTMKYLWKNIDGSPDTPVAEGEANPDTLDISPAATAIFASCLAAGAFALIRKSARR
jgi:hypothetical protein